MKNILALLFTALLPTLTYAGEFNPVAQLKVNTEAGIKRYELHKDIGLNPLSGLPPSIKHSDETKVGDVTIEFINYKDTRKTISYSKLLADLDKEGYRAATVQELCSVQSGIKEIPGHKKLFCYGTQVYVGPHGIELCGIYYVSIVDKSNVELLNQSEKTFEPGFVIAAIRLK